MKSFTFTTSKAFETPSTLWEWLVSLKAETKLEVSVKVIQKNHSDNQRRRYFARHVHGMMELVNHDREWPLSKDQVHDRLKRSFIGEEDSPLGPVAMSTKRYDIAGFSDYCHRIDEWVLQKWGVVLPEYGDDY